MSRAKKFLSIVMILCVIISFTVQPLAASGEYIAVAYSSTGVYQDSKLFADEQSGYTWLKNNHRKGCVAIRSTGEILGVVLADTVIDYSAGNYIINNGSTGSYVTAVQTTLLSLGYTIKVDGVFGNQTKSVVEAFQLKNGRTVDGIVGQNTYASLATEGQ